MAASSFFILESGHIAAGTFSSLEMFARCPAGRRCLKEPVCRKAFLLVLDDASAYAPTVASAFCFVEKRNYGLTGCF